MVLLQDGEGFSKVVNMGPSDFTLDEYIIHIYLHVLSDLVFESFIYKTLIS